MNAFRLLKNSLTYYWKSNLAILLGVIAGTAVIGGALIVGDSVRDSLKKMSLDRLGHIDHVLTGHRYFREQLASDLADLPEFQERFSAIAPAILMKGSLEVQAEENTRRAGQVNVYGIDERLWSMTDADDVPAPTEREVLLSSRLADQLQVKTGDEVSLWIELPSSIPRDSLLGERDETAREIVLTVKHVFPEISGIGRLALNPNQQLPSNAFLSLATLQSSLDLEEIRRSRRNKEGRPARVNTLFVSAKNLADQQQDTAPIAARTLTDLTAKTLSLTDFSLKLLQHAEKGYLSLESGQMILEDQIANVGQQVAKELSYQQSPVLVYIANEISNSTNPKWFSSYSVLAGVDFSADAPFGPMQFTAEALQVPLKSDEIILNDWLADDVKVKPGEKVHITYYEIGAHTELLEEELEFTVRGIVKLDGTPAEDQGFTPVVEGITDVGSLADWDQPFPMKLDRVTDRDDLYWDRYRATPKAFVSLEAAQNLWQSRYGKLTSLRVAPQKNEDLDAAAETFTQKFLSSLDPKLLGLTFLPVKYNGLTAASGTTDFSGLFIGFSFFLILSGTILIGLLFRLAIERRGKNIGLLSAVGFSAKQVRNLFLAEGLLVVCVGGVLGLFAAVGYAGLMVAGLKSDNWWNAAIGTKFLYLSVQPVSLIVGYLISVFVAGFAVWWALKELRSLSARDLLTGSITASLSLAAQTDRSKRASRIAQFSFLLSALLVVLSVVGMIPKSEAFSGFSVQVIVFFLVGIALLTASLSALSAWLDSDRSVAVRGAGFSGLGRLGMRNAARNRQRSVMTVGLIASATFVIVAVAAGQRNPAVETPVLNSGNGGFTLVAESSTAILYDLNTADGRDSLNLTAGNENTDGSNLLEEMFVMPFRKKEGEQASCLNLYQTKLPTVLGVPQQMIERGGFKFADTPGSNPWELLEAKADDGTIPVLGDLNTLMYSLHKGIGTTIPVPDEDNVEFILKVAGMFDGSVFQGVLLMSEENFLKVYPEEAGYSYFLVETPLVDANSLTNLLETGLTEFGFDAERVADRLANFLAVQNTYLSTFQTLGGLGLLLGTLGLSTVMLRNVLERRSEIALLRSVGFTNLDVGWLVMLENAFLLVWGLIAGTVSALLSMLPHLLSTGADVPWAAGAVILISVFCIGMLAALVAVREAMSTPLVTSLRSE